MSYRRRRGYNPNDNNDNDTDDDARSMDYYDSDGYGYDYYGDSFNDPFNEITDCRYDICSHYTSLLPTK